MQAQAPSQMTATNLKVLIDQMNHEALASKKCDFFAQQISDPALKGTIASLSQHHRANFDKLFNYLSSHQ
ncbi:MAG: hypothetical protein LBU67_04865 [Oscillospiraceae bacterium]|nr:hypothetical protein [Oscillospiraceae bacterium]